MYLILKIYFLLFCFFTFGSIGSFSQNLVQNPSFEDTVYCPFDQNQVQYSSSWLNFGYSPDYFNSCSVSPNFSVPNNWGGYQQASSGTAYAAVFTIQHGFNNIREFVGSQLLSNLIIGVKYFVSFQANLSLSDTIQVNCATNHLGAMFSTVPYSSGNLAPINNSPQVYTNILITDTANWTRVFGSFIADSSYQYLIVGNFFDDNNTDTLIMDGDALCWGAYYFIDDVCVSTDSLYTLNYDYNTGVIEYYDSKSFLIYPNPAKEYFFVETKGETFTVKIYDVLGKELFNQNNIIDQKYRIDLSDFNSGMLIINLYSNGRNYNYKLLKP